LASDKITPHHLPPANLRIGVTSPPGVKDVQAHYGGILTAGKAVDQEIALRTGAKFNLPFFSVAGLGLETGHPVVGSIDLMTRAANAD